jgi:hypothetical protein
VTVLLSPTMAIAVDILYDENSLQITYTKQATSLYWKCDYVCCKRLNEFSY